MVLEEIAMYEDDPQDQIHDLASHAVFPDQALGRPVIGTRRGHRLRPRADGVRAYHGDHYTAPNMVVAAAGNITHERVHGAVRAAARRPVDRRRARAPTSPRARAPRPWS